MIGRRKRKNWVVKERSNGWTYFHYKQENGWYGFMVKDGKQYICAEPQMHIFDTEKQFNIMLNNQTNGEK